MHSTLHSALCALSATLALAAPLEGRQVQSPIEQPSWSAGAVTEYPIHSSCNSTETALLRQALDEAETLALHAKNHIMRFGNSSSFYTKYFGKANTGEPAGWFDKIANGDKAGVVLRCDDIDGNCHQDGWAGHWRGSNATDENVICELSFTSKWPLAGLCGYGYSVASHKTTSFFSSDLLHRIYHTDKVGEGVVGHYADTYQACLRLATENPQEAVRNSATLRYFALDVYAYDISVPGQGCTGEPLPEEEGDQGHGSASTTSSATATTSAEAVVSSEASTPTTNESASATQAASTECHTHDDGVVHCT